MGTWVFSWILFAFILGVTAEPAWDNDHMHIVPTDKKQPLQQEGRPATYGDYINPPGQGVETDWAELAQRKIQEANEKIRKINKLDKSAKNVIFMMGDGMGISTITAARVYLAQSREIIGEDAILSWENFSNVALSRTYGIDVLTSDSANTATAMMCGEKARETVICGNQHVISANCSSLQGNKLKSVLHSVIEDGDRTTGIISTARITHASPATVFAHAAHRDWESDSLLPDDADDCTDMASQLIDEELNKRIRVILSGGREHFLPNTTQDPEYPGVNGRRTDGRDLIQEWIDAKAAMGLDEDEYRYVDNLADFEAVDPEDAQYLMGLFEPSYMHYENDRPNKTMNPFGEPSLADMVEKAIHVLEKNHEGYFLFVEAGRIDTAHHANNAYRALNDTAALHDAVQRAVDLTDEDETLIVVTADHSHVFTISGYPAINTNIFTYNQEYERKWGFQIGDDEKAYTTLQYANGPGYYVHRTTTGDLTDEVPRKNLTNQQSVLGYDDFYDRGWGYQVGDDGNPYMVLTYANGPGYYSHRTEDGTLSTEVPRKNLTVIYTEDPDFVQDAGVPLYSETHGGEDVAIFARGPMAHLFNGVQEQNYIAHVLKYAMCVGDNTDLCDNPPEPICGDSGSSMLKSTLTVALLCILSVLIVT